MSRKARTIALCTACLVRDLLSIRAAHAQNRPEPFSELEFQIALSKNVSHDLVLDSWRAGAANSVTAAAPFYAGYVSVGAKVEPFATGSPSLPEFTSLYISLGWGMRWTSSKKTLFEAGARLGTFFMSFDDDTYSGVVHENETAWNLYAALQMPKPFWRPASLPGSGRLLGAGVDVRFQSGTLADIRLSYSWSGILTSSNPTFRDLYQGTLGHELLLTGLLTPHSRLHAFVRARYRPSIRWLDDPIAEIQVACAAELSAGAERTNPDCRGDAHSLLSIDLTVQKKLYRDHARIRLSLLNLGRTPIVRHPAGEALYPALRLSMTFTVNNPEASSQN